MTKVIVLFGKRFVIVTCHSSEMLKIRTLVI